MLLWRTRRRLGWRSASCRGVVSPGALPPWVMCSANQPVGEDIWIMAPSFASLSAGHAAELGRPVNNHGVPREGLVA